jgi:3-deoxy-D-manno-octulosonate 8-phosphate phosphatase (KDO 8-P phosphatase)
MMTNSNDTKNIYSNELLQKANAIRLLICDVDGVLSNGKVYYTNDGEEIKSFNIKDGLGIKLLMQNEIQVAIITGRQSKIVTKRAKELGIELIFQGRADKQAAYDEILEYLSLEKHQVAHVGDDLPDLPLMKQSGLGICVADGYSLVKQEADWITSAIGGNGAVREICDLLLFAQNRIQKIHQKYLTK